MLQIDQHKGSLICSTGMNSCWPFLSTPNMKFALVSLVAVAASAYVLEKRGTPAECDKYEAMFPECAVGTPALTKYGYDG